MKASGLARIARDPEVKSTAGGMSVLELRLAYRQFKADSDGFIDAAIFGKRADSLAPFLHKGDQVVVHGALKFREYEKDGVKHQRFSIAVDDVELVSGKRDGAQASAPAQSAPIDEDEIPF